MKINCKGTLVDLTSPKVMGILNLTPDSFFEPSRHDPDGNFLKTAERMLQDGAQFLDLGAYSSRPGAPFVAESQELSRLMPALELLLKHFPQALVSIDTFRSRIAREAVEAGAAMVNDISAGHLDEAMMGTVAQLQVPYVMMHMRGTPQTMQNFTVYQDLIKDVLLYFSDRIAVARSHQINDLIVDPGFGFSKDIAQNFALMNKLDLFHLLELPLLIGISRKGMIYKSLNSSAEEALNGTTVLNTVALAKGANILRVHDVKEAMEVIRLYGLITSG